MEELRHLLVVLLGATLEDEDADVGDNSVALVPDVLAKSEVLELVQFDCCGSSDHAIAPGLRVGDPPLVEDVEEERLLNASLLHQE